MTTVDNSRINMKDVSFLIPVRIDSTERYRNLLLLLKYLNQYTDTHILVLEADSCSKISSHLFRPNVCHFFVEDKEEKFHRTHYINQLTKMADTPYICICDTDVIVPLPQLEETVRLLREGYAYVLPYDGAFVVTTEKEKQLFLEKLSCEVFNNEVVWNYVCGGAIFLNKKDFIQAGMSNEHLTSWGPDDVEQKKRMEVLGFSMIRVDGPLFHLWHPRGVNSSYDTQDERIRLTEEYVKIASFGKIELMQYVDTWSWCKEEEKREEVNVSSETLMISENDFGLMQGKTGAAFVYLCRGYEGDREKAMALLNQVDALFAKELPDNKVGIAWAVGLMRKKYDVPADFEQICLKVEGWLFTSLKVPGKVKLGGEDGIIFIGWYYHALLKEIDAGHYHPVFYKEQLIFVIDQIYEQVLGKDRIERSDTDVVKFLGQALLLMERLKFLGVNTLKIEKICAGIEKKAYVYLSRRERFQPADGWLLYALLSSVEEKRASVQFPELAGWSKEYLQQCDFTGVDSRLYWIRNLLCKSVGIEVEKENVMPNDFFSMLVALNVPLNRLYAWLFI